MSEDTNVDAATQETVAKDTAKLTDREAKQGAERDKISKLATAFKQGILDADSLDKCLSGTSAASLRKAFVSLCVAHFKTDE